MHDTDTHRQARWRLAAVGFVLLAMMLAATTAPTTWLVVGGLAAGYAGAVALLAEQQMADRGCGPGDAVRLSAVRSTPALLGLVLLLPVVPAG
jgi:hypothetical protein